MPWAFETLSSRSMAVPGERRERCGSAGSLTLWGVLSAALLARPTQRVSGLRWVAGIVGLASRGYGKASCVPGAAGQIRGLRSALGSICDEGLESP